MIGRENSEDQFEKEWREAFSEESQTPPASVWAEIDRKLAYAELGVYKTRAVYYQVAVAAILLLAVSLGTFQYWYFQQKTQQVAYVSPINVDSPAQANEYRYDGYIPPAVVEPSLPIGSGGILALASNEDQDEASNGTKMGANWHNSPEEAAISGERILLSAHSVEPFPANVGAPAIVRNTQKKMYRVPVYHFEKQRETDKQEDKYWAGVSFGSGGFDPNYEASGGSLLAGNLNVNPAAFSLADNEALDTNSPSVREGMLPGESVSLGVNFGLKLSSRWSVESGVQYARADATTQTNVVIQTSTFQEVIPATSQVRGIQQFESVVEREEIVEYSYRDVNLKNEFQFTSVPVKAGYLLFNKKFHMEVNAGMVANFYMGNKLSGTDSGVAELTLGPGDESPYREVSFSGLAGLEFGYRFMKNFDVVIEPNYRRSLNSLTKDNTSFTTNPSGFGVLTGIRYNFN